jgi:hypothetical protein
MKARQVIEEILSKVFKWHRFPVSLKAEAVLLYFKGLSLQKRRDAPLTRDLVCECSQRASNEMGT